MYHYGLGTSVDNQKAFTYFTKAAQDGFPQAEYHLGIIYEKGLWVKKDIDQAILWFEKAADQNLTEAQLIMSERLIREPDDVGLYVKNELK